VGVAEIMKRALVIGATLAVLAAGCGSTKTVTVTRSVTTVKTVTTAPTTAPATTTQSAGPAPCSGSDLQATFSVIAGSAGAGQIGYELVLTNNSSAACTVSGWPIAALLDKSGAALPTQALSAHLGQPATIVLQHGDTAKADARFSPDVPGTGEQQTGPCEATSYFLLITATGGGTVKTPVSPPTPVCEHGSLNFSAFTPGG
jgi:Protein of unknown function (DUF4232)